MEPTLEGLAKYEQEFQVRDETNVTFNAKWQWSPSQPWPNKHGVTGWALSDGKVIRLHVCANSPCTARYPASKYVNLPVPRHVRLTKPGTAAAAAESATTVALPAPAAGSGAASSGANEVCPPVAAEPAIAAPQAPAVAGPGAEPPEASPPDVVVAGPPPGLNSVAAAVLGPDEQSAASKLAEKSQVAPPPPPAPKSTMAEVVPPPGRATLLPMPSATPCQPVAAPVVAQKQTVETPAVAGSEDVDDEVVAATVLENAEVAAEMNKFIKELQAPCKYVGISAFLIFVLRYRLRVCVWYGTRCEDLLSAYAPWPSDVITHKALFQAVCCKYRGDGSLDFIWDNPQHTNHWVASIPIGSGDYHSHGDGESEVTDTFYGIYLSLSIRIVTTVLDGDCGLDVMCLMLGWKRCKQNRFFFCDLRWPPLLSSTSATELSLRCCIAWES